MITIQITGDNIREVETILSRLASSDMGTLQDCFDDLAGDFNTLKMDVDHKFTTQQKDLLEAAFKVWKKNGNKEKS